MGRSGAREAVSYDAKSVFQVARPRSSVHQNLVLEPLAADCESERSFNLNHCAMEEDDVIEFEDADRVHRFK
jgi:hypothetical protein